jgi:5'-nucleotidase (lipoprotein e(P4) family)
MDGAKRAVALVGVVALLGVGFGLGRAAGRAEGISGDVPRAVAGQEVNLQAEAMLLGVMWTQGSGEARALRMQAYELARLRLAEALKEAGAAQDGRRPAVVLDIDETVLDNSPQLASQALTDGQYSQERWRRWSSRASAEAIPGAKRFLDDAHARGVAVFYVSNRAVEELDDTLKNLREAGFPQVSASQVMLRTDDSSKEERRREIAKNHQILMYVGDALGDFDAAFEKKSVAERREAVDQLAGAFGRKFIVLPNAAYGDWDNAVLDYRRFDPPMKMRALRRGSLKSFEEAENVRVAGGAGEARDGKPLAGFEPGCVVGNSKSRIFHAEDSRYYEQAKGSKNAVFFRDGADAEAAGYREARGR